MSITSVTQAANFDQAAYDELLAAAKTEYVAQSKVDEQLLLALNSGKSFSEAVAAVKSDLPTLPPPMGTGEVWSNGLPGLPSFGANYLAMITDIASEQRRQNAQMRADQTEEIVAKIHDQTDEMRTKAIVQLVIGVVSGTISIAQGAASTAMTVKGMRANETSAVEARDRVIDQGTGGGTKPLTEKQMNKLLTKSESTYTSTRQQADMLLNTRVGSFNSGMGGITGIMGSASQSVGTFFDANIKEMEADVERMRAQQDALKSLAESLQAVIQKALSTQDAIQQSMNQARTKIMG